MAELTERDDLDGLWFAVGDRPRVLRALAEQAASEGFAPVALDELAPYGRWLHGEEDPSVLRYAVAPPHGGWVGVFPSQPDWDHERAPALAEILGCLACCLMLHDGDVLTVHLHDGPRLLAAHCSSPVHFDQEGPPPGELDFEPSRLLRACRTGTTREQLLEALTPPGRLDVDGRRAFAGLAELFDLGPAAGLTYAALLREDGLSLRPELAGFEHLAFRLEDEEDSDEGGGELLRFPGAREPQA